MVSIKGNSVEVKNNHRLLSTFHITDVRKTTMVEKVEELLPNFKKFGRKGKLCMNADLFEDLGWKLDRDPPDLTVFRYINTNKSKESVENAIKGVAQNISKIQNIIQVPSVKTNTPNSYYVLQQLVIMFRTFGYNKLLLLNSYYRVYIYSWIDVRTSTDTRHR